MGPQNKKGEGGRALIETAIKKKEKRSTIGGSGKEDQDVNTRILRATAVRHTGQSPSLSPHVWQTTRWRQGMRRQSRWRSRHTTHSCVPRSASLAAVRPLHSGDDTDIVVLGHSLHVSSVSLIASPNSPELMPADGWVSAAAEVERETARELIRGGSISGGRTRAAPFASTESSASGPPTIGPVGRLGLRSSDRSVARELTEEGSSGSMLMAGGSPMWRPGLRRNERSDRREAVERTLSLSWGSRPGKRVWVARAAAAA
jgi:hypothetical protein